MKISVIGLGYIGLPTSAALASRGTRVLGVDLNTHFVDEINAGRVPIVEPDLDAAVEKAVADGMLTASTQVEAADAFLIAVPTPFKGEHEPDLSYIESAVSSIAPVLQPGNTVILESTSPAGTTRKIAEWLAQARPDLTFPHDHESPDVFVAHCPERVLPGRIMIEMVSNDRVVGGISPHCAQKAAEIYRIFCQGEILLTDATSAEMAKLTENAFRDVNIAFANELAEICRHIGVDVWEVIRLANRHPRVNILNPGPGVGGHCIAVDPWFIVDAAPDQANLIRTARETNDARPDTVVADVARIAPSGAVIACLGLAFKANIDDLRESPAVTVVSRLSKADPTWQLLAVEPHVEHLPAALETLENVRLEGLDVALASADAVVLLVDHDRFKAISNNEIRQIPHVDTRGIWRE